MYQRLCFKKKLRDPYADDPVGKLLPWPDRTDGSVGEVRRDRRSLFVALVCCLMNNFRAELRQGISGSPSAVNCNNWPELRYAGYQTTSTSVYPTSESTLTGYSLNSKSRSRMDGVWGGVSGMDINRPLPAADVLSPTICPVWHSFSAGFLGSCQKARPLPAGTGFLPE